MSPAALLVAGLGLAVAGIAVCLWLSLRQPWLGLTPYVPDNGPGLIVAEDTGDWRLLALAAPGGERMDLAARDLLEEPDFLRTYAEYADFLARQDRLHAILSGDRLVLYPATGPPREVRPSRNRPLASLPAAFWFQLAFAVICLGIATAVWAFRRDRAGTLFGITGLGLFVVGLSAAVYSTRELALSADLFRALAVANHGGGMLFSGAFVATLWHYPNRLTALPAARLSFVVFGIVWVLDSVWWLPNVDAGFRYPLLIGLVFTMVLAVEQWRRLDSPVDRAAMRWFAFAWFAGSSLFVSLMFLPVLFGGSPIFPQSYSFGLLLPIYAGVAAGVARYRLFQLERWWYPTLAGFAALLAVLLATPLVAQVTRWPQSWALLAVIAAAGWIYFPLRVWLGRRRARRRRARDLPLLGDALDVLFNPRHESGRDALWRGLLERAFSPMEIRRERDSSARIRVSADGSTLWTPAEDGLPGYSLRWPDRGARLFDDADLRLVETLLPLTAYASDLRGAWEAGAAAERARIKTDLEDDLAARLYEQILRAGSDEIADAARGALAEVRLLIDQLDAGRRPAAEAIDDWRAQIADLCEQGGVALAWRQYGEMPARDLGPQARANPLRILREALANALAHSRPTHIEVAVATGGDDIGLTMEYDSDAEAPSRWEVGRGLLNMQARARQLGGELRWSQPEPGRIRLECRLRLELGT
ncbi:sensor histidine kinase [Salinisphaera sp. PC39]